MNYLRFVLAGAAAAIGGLVAFGLASSNQVLWAVVGAAAAFGAVVLASTLTLRADDRDPTIRPTNVTRGDRRPKN